MRRLKSLFAILRTPQETSGTGQDFSQSTSVYPCQYYFTNVPLSCVCCLADGQWPLKADSHIACRAHAATLPCRAAKGLECVFPIWFTQCGLVWFTLAMPCHAHAALMPCSDHAVLLKATAQHGRRETACGLPARVRLLPATTRSSTKIVIRSIPILTTIHTYDCKVW
jgi:hypothetical protein